MTPGDIGLVINTHLHFDHCGQNAVFKHAAFYVQSAELARARRESPELAGWFDFMDARFELLDGLTLYARASHAEVARVAWISWAREMREGAAHKHAHQA